MLTCIRRPGCLHPTGIGAERLRRRALYEVKMKPMAICWLLVLLAAPLAGCHDHAGQSAGGAGKDHGGFHFSFSDNSDDSKAKGSGVHFGFGNGDVAYDKHTIVIKVPDLPRARVTPDGSLLLDEKPVALSAAGQAAMARYYTVGRGFGNQAVQLGFDSADFALHTVGSVFEGLLHGDTDRIGKDAKQGGEAIKNQAKALCQSLDDWRSAQDAAAAAVAEFKPYAVIGQHDSAQCVVDDKDSDQPAKPAAAAKT